MTFAPALTWMHLLPAGVVPTVSGDAPPELRDRLGPATAGGEAAVIVNAGRMAVAQLRAAGYGHVRRFAVLPNLGAARWFIPVLQPAVASAAFGVYSPTRFTARAKRTAARFAARLGLPGWYRDSVTIGLRNPPPLERHLAASLGTDAELRLSLSAGAPEPARNRKASAAVIRLDGTVLGFAKIAGSPLATRLLRQEADTLKALAARPAVADVVPKLLASGVADGRYFLIQSPLHGTAAPARMTADHRRFLTALQDGPPRPAADTEYVQSLLPRLLALGDDGADLVPVAERVAASLATCRVRPTIVHGDFAPWNLRIQPDGRVAAFDWEYGRTDGLPTADAAHHELQVGYNMHNWSPADAAAALDAQASHHPDVSTCHVAALQNAYLVDVLTRLAEEGYGPSDRMVRWHRDLLDNRVAAVPAPTPVAA